MKRKYNAAIEAEEFYSPLLIEASNMEFALRAALEKMDELQALGVKDARVTRIIELVLPPATPEPADESKSILWTAPMLARFKVARKKASDAHEESFNFDGDEFLVSYAGYLIEYLETKLK